VEVRYHSHNPHVNAAIPFGHYVSVDRMPKSSTQSRLFVSLGVSLFGGLIVFLSLRDQQQSDQPQNTALNRSLTEQQARADRYLTLQR
jgi:hypothetical protein